MSKPTAIVLACFALGACSKDLTREVPDAGMPDASVTPRPVVFINPAPTQFTQGVADSVMNVTSIGDATFLTTGLPASAAAIWPDVLTCLQQMVMPYNVDVVDEDPGDVEHIEIALSGDPEDLGYSGAAGVAPVSSDCTGQPRGVAFAFAGVYSDDVEASCNNLGWLLGHTVGIDSLLHCPDVNTFLTGCGPKSFTDNDSECGEYAPRQCLCGGATQNAHQRMLIFYGPRE